MINTIYADSPHISHWQVNFAIFFTFSTLLAERKIVMNGEIFFFGKRAYECLGIKDFFRLVY